MIQFYLNIKVSLEIKYLILNIKDWELKTGKKKK